MTRPNLEKVLDRKRAKRGRIVLSGKARARVLAVMRELWEHEVLAGLGTAAIERTLKDYAGRHWEAIQRKPWVEREMMKRLARVFKEVGPSLFEGIPDSMRLTLGVRRVAKAEAAVEGLREFRETVFRRNDEVRTVKSQGRPLRIPGELQQTIGILGEWFELLRRIGRKVASVREWTTSDCRDYKYWFIETALHEGKLCAPQDLHQIVRALPPRLQDLTPFGLSESLYVNGRMSTLL